MSRYDYDLFVIGAGSGGVRAARLSAGFGARVAVAESGRLGGTCVNLGCIPKKLFSYAAHYHEEFEDSVGFGWNPAAPDFDWSRLVENKDREIARLNGVYERILKGAGVEIIQGRAVVADPHTVEVDGRRFSAERILVATGGRAVVPDIPGRELAITSDQAFHLPRLPKRVLVVGAGYIAVEFASIFNGLGVDTTLSYRGGRLLRGFDGETAGVLAEEMSAKGVAIRFHTQVERIEQRGSVLSARFADGGEISVGAVMYATGRAPNTAGLGLAEAGVELAPNGAVVVRDHSFQSSVPSIHALGDVIDRIQLTPVALAEAIVLANNLYGGKHRAMDYENVPTAIFAHPNVGTVGLSEEAARERHGAVDVYASRFRALKHTLSGRQEKTFMKLVVDPASDRVLGAHMVGADAGETVQGLAIALKCGATKAQFDSTIGIHPTAAEEFVTLREKRA